jgi:hypothetical protein
MSSVGEMSAAQPTNAEQSVKIGEKLYNITSIEGSVCVKPVVVQMEVPGGAKKQRKSSKKQRKSSKKKQRKSSKKQQRKSSKKQKKQQKK